MAAKFAFFFIVVFLAITSYSQSPCYGDGGTPIVCRPAVQSNIVSGRVAIATSTCGVAGPERICERSGQSCMVCDDSHVSTAHPTQLMTDGREDTYWLSQTYDFIKDGVNITFNLQKTFTIEKVSFIFYSPRPESFSLFVSKDYGLTYSPLHYFSQSCKDTYGLPDDNSRIGVRCTSEGTGLVPLTRGEAIFKPHQTTLATDVQIRLDRLSTLGDELTWNSTVLDSYYYGLYNVVIEGRCFCNGHASMCSLNSNGLLQCDCQHNTTGQDCQMCLPTHNNQPWSIVTEDNARGCEECRCNGRATLCDFDNNLYLLSGNTSGGVCQNCQKNTTGNRCQQCLQGFYPDPISHELNCISCVCDPRGIEGGDGTCTTAELLYNMSNDTCVCKSEVSGQTCNTCLQGYFNLTTSGCQECSCNTEGSISNICDPEIGQCQCKSPLYYGRTCQSCDCNVTGTVDIALGCDDEGVCQCRNGVGGVKCNECLSGYYNIHLGCIACKCHVNGSYSTDCDHVTGQCSCRPGYFGRDCRYCPDGFSNIDNSCQECPGCYDEVSDEIIKTTFQLQLLVATVHQSLNSSRNDPALVELVQVTYNKLLELREQVRNFSLREVEMKKNLDNVKEEIKMRIREVERFSQFVRLIETTNRTASQLLINTKVNIIEYTRQLSTINYKLNEIALSNLTTAQELEKKIKEMADSLRRITVVLEAAALNQSKTVSELVRETYLLVDNTTDLMLSMCELLDIENATLVHLRGLIECSVAELDLLFREAQMKLEQAARNSSHVLSESIDLNTRVSALDLLDYDSEYLLETAQRLLANVSSVFQDGLNALNITIILRDNYTRLYFEAQELFSRADYLNRTAVELFIREHGARALANISTIEGEKVISEIESLLFELNRRLQDILTFLAKLNEVTAVVEEAERVSNISRQEAEEQAKKLANIEMVVKSTVLLFNSALSALEEAMTAVSAANITANVTLATAEQLLNKLLSLPENINKTEQAIRALEERGEKDSVAIGSAETAINNVVTELSGVESRAQRVTELLSQLEINITSINFVSQSDFERLSLSLDQVEMLLVNTTSYLSNVTVEVDTLERQSDILQAKYIKLQQHRDLLKDILSNLDHLDCEKEFV